MNNDEKIIRVLVVDDSPLIRGAIVEMLSSDPCIEVVAEAVNGLDGVEKAAKYKPDVITMDMKMPIMTGSEAIKTIMEDNPIPIIVVSSIDTSVVVHSLEMGAMDFISLKYDVRLIEEDLREKVKIASRVRPIKRIKFLEKSGRHTVSVKEKPTKIIAIGISTGGPQALHQLLSKFPQDLAATIIIVQHITTGFVEGLTQWLKSVSDMDIKIAEKDESLCVSTIFIAPDDHTVEITDHATFVLKPENKASKTLSSIDTMMKSVARVYKENVVGVLMTGMGKDGMEGMLEIKRCGGSTIAQDEASSAVFGMNKAAIDTGCVDKVMPLDKIADEIIRMAGRTAAK